MPFKQIVPLANAHRKQFDHIERRRSAINVVAQHNLKGVGDRISIAVSIDLGEGFLQQVRASMHVPNRIHARARRQFGVIDFSRLAKGPPHFLTTGPVTRTRSELSAGQLFTANGLKTRLKLALNITKTAMAGQGGHPTFCAIGKSGASLACERSGGLGTSGSIKSSGKDQKFEQGAAQISDLQARRANNIREHDRPDRCTLSEPESGTYKKAEQYRRKQHKYSEPQAERRPDTQHR